ncbi:MAG: hypothetical protein A2622_12105 [Bdellovibrionales bacterium RIFCSPHIGHO2_01_FULL_40_29]|nr:MAG: hypothetical protein A2622_12105 [Bdellovibrionales bacterium RIFCSPHIGHO2_01_FULL_40_29]OFZ32934.1 MAG: hypothetical protein A3D17_09410 [Bdellovibrionales bacterium RIFCSPHIGHO2_02_FULL_40_15]
MYEFLQSLLHIDATINLWAQTWGLYLYLILFLIIFAETGLIVTPFLPGDSLLFAVGALAATSTAFDIKILIPLLVSAALLGDSLNFIVGKKFGRRLFENESRLFKRSYLMKTEFFYEKHGNKAVFMARFFPILRTFAPFVAGLGQMPYRTFVSMSILGSICWINSFTLTGYFFGQIPVIQKNFTVLVMALVLLPAVPILIAFFRSILNKYRTQ